MMAPTPALPLSWKPPSFSITTRWGHGIACILHDMDSYKNVFEALEHAKVHYLIVGGVAMSMKDYFSSVDREQLRRIKYGTTPEQRMNWLEDAAAFVKESRKNWKKRPPTLPLSSELGA